jgi:hypothetical protein
MLFLLKKEVQVELSKERQGELAMIALLEEKTSNGIMLKPKEVKREIKNAAKRVGISEKEVAEFYKIVLESVYQRTVLELDAIIKSGKVEE